MRSAVLLGFPNLSSFNEKQGLGIKQILIQLSFFNLAEFYLIK